MSERDPRGNHLTCTQCPDDFAHITVLLRHWKLLHGNPYGRPFEITMDVIYQADWGERPGELRGDGGDGVALQAPSTGGGERVLLTRDPSPETGAPAPAEGGPVPPMTNPLPAGARE